jgi:hypothetical protein
MKVKLPKHTKELYIFKDAAWYTKRDHAFPNIPFLRFFFKQKEFKKRCILRNAYSYARQHLPGWLAELI